MASPRPRPDVGSGGRPDRGAPRSKPRWGLVLAIVIAIALIGLMVFLHLSGTLGPGVH